MARSAEIRVTANPERPSRRPRPRLRKAAIHAFVGIHLAAVICWSFVAPKPAWPLERLLRTRLAPYMLPTGLWQQWDMFANAPISNNYLEADVTFADGARATWPFPRVDRLPYFQRYRNERYRKWATEWLIAGGRPNPVVAEAAARFAARQVERPGNPPRKVELIRYRSQIPAPRRGQLRPYDEAPRDWERQLLYACEFDAAGKMTAAWATTQPAATQPGGTPPAATQPADGPADEAAPPEPAPPEAAPAESTAHEATAPAGEKR